MKPTTAWNWLQEHQDEFDNIKSILSNPMLLSAYNPKLKSIVVTDAASLKGIGWILTQHVRYYTDEKGRKREQRNIIECGSSLYSKAQENYSIVEKEGLAAVTATCKLDYFLRGSKFQIEVDHKPLIGCFSKNLQDISNPRLSRLAEKLIPYDYEIVYIKGETNWVADILSRQPRQVIETVDIEEEETDNKNKARCLKLSWTTKAVEERNDPQLQYLFEAADSCKEYEHLMEHVRKGTELSELDKGDVCHSYKQMWGQM